MHTSRTILYGTAACACLLSFTLSYAAAPKEETPTDAGTLRPDPAPGGMFQAISPSGAFVIQTDHSQSYLSLLNRRVTEVEQRMLQLFKIPPGFLRGNDPKVKLDNRYANIKGDLLSSWGYKPWIEVRVFNKFEDFADEYFDLSDRLYSIINNKPQKQETPEQRAMRRLTEGVPGAVYWRISDYDRKYKMRLIRAYVGPKNPEEVAADLLHEMGHLFLETYLLEFAGAPKAGNEAEKRGTPAWIGEGVAQLFQVNWADSKEAKKKRKQYQAMIFEAIEQGDAYNFGEFINVTNAHNLQAVAGNPLKATINYAQSWSVMQYMVEVKWQAFLEFLANCRAYNLEDMMKRKKKISELYSIQDRAFKDAFSVPIAEVEEHWKKHVRRTMENELKKDPADWYWCGEYHLRRKGPDYLAKAEERFKKAAEGAPKDGKGHLGLGRVALAKKDVKAATTHLTEASKLSPKDEDVWYYLGVALVRAGKSKDAIASFEKSVELYALFHQAHSGLADAYFEAREFKKAMESYNKAFEIAKHPRYLFSIGQAAFFAKEYEEAMKNFAAYCNIFKNDPQGHFWYGMAAQRLDQNEYAIKKIEEALKLNPNDKTFKNALAMAKEGKPMRFSIETEEKKPEDQGKVAAPSVPDIEDE